MVIHYEENLDLIPKDVEFVVYTPAIPEEHIEFQYYKERDYAMAKRAEVLGALSRSMTTIS